MEEHSLKCEVCRFKWPDGLPVKEGQPARCIVCRGRDQDGRRYKDGRLVVEKFPLRCGICHARYPNGRQEQVGQAWTDGFGRWIAYPVRRNGPRRLSGGLIGPLNYHSTDAWPPNPSTMPAFVEMALNRPFNPEVVECVYVCRHKHDVGASDADELIGWLELAREHGKYLSLSEASCGRFYVASQASWVTLG